MKQLLLLLFRYRYSQVVVETYLVLDSIDSMMQVWANRSSMIEDQGVHCEACLLDFVKVLRIDITSEKKKKTNYRYVPVQYHHLCARNRFEQVIEVFCDWVVDVLRYIRGTCQPIIDVVDVITFSRLMNCRSSHVHSLDRADPNAARRPN